MLGEGYEKENIITVLCLCTLDGSCKCICSKLFKDSKKSNKYALENAKHEKDKQALEEANLEKKRERTAKHIEDSTAYYNKNASNTNKKQNIQAVNHDKTKSNDKLNKDIKADVNNKESQQTKDNKKEDTKAKDKTTNKKTVTENGSYSSKEEVALYIHTYGKLPSNYITKSQAKDLGWDSKKANLWEVAKGKSIGGDRFSNRERTLPYKQGRQYYECDIDYDGAHRGAKRIVYSSDGLVYYTEDHYATFTLLYGQENM